MSKINSIEALRDHALLTLEKLSSGDIDCAEAGVTGKLCESVISTIKAQLEYSRMLQEEPQIPFMQKSHIKALEGSIERKQLSAPKK
jgi:hypothetical protein